MEATTAWRSPLSILLGARRNDADLELREDLFHPPPSLAAPNSPAAAMPDATEVERPSGLSSYNPLNYFGLTSSARANANANANTSNGRHGIGNSHEQEMSQDQTGAPAPPMGAFPPPITESPAEHTENGSDRFISSHPWFNQLELADTNHENNLPDQPHRPPELEGTRATSRKKHLTWEDQKAIIGTTVNFTNSIIGAGAIGLGGAFAASGGGISVMLLLGFAYLTKISLDLVVDLSSCPSVIRMVRVQEIERNANDREIVSSGGSSSPDSERIIEESKKNESSHEENSFENILDEIENPPGGEHSEDVKAAGEEKEKDANVGSSPLMAQEEDKYGHDEAADPFQVPSNPEVLEADYPLMGSPERPEEHDQHNLLTLGVTQPKPFPAVAPKAEEFPNAKSAPSIQNDNSVEQSHLSMFPCTYEELGYAAFGTAGRLAVLISKALYSFGCLIAYVVVVRDNFGPALRRMIVGSSSPNFIEGEEDQYPFPSTGILYDDGLLAFWVSSIVMLPLSCPRTMKPLAKFSFLSVVAIAMLVLSVVYLYFTCTNPEGGTTGKASFYENWIQIRSFSGLIESLGCFVFTFVCHHTANLAYDTLPPPIRTPQIWRRVSTNSIALALQASLTVGVFAYLTFGSQTAADVLVGYPSDLTLANVARLLLCLTMALTFPLPFLTCREMSILIFLDMHKFYHVNRLNRFNIFPHIMCANNNKGNQNRQAMNTQRAVGEDLADETEFVHMQIPFFKRWGTGRGRARNLRELDNDEWGHIDPATEALLLEMEHEPAIIASIGGQHGEEINPSPLSSRSGDLSSSDTTVCVVVTPPSWILDGGRQLTLLWHSALTFTLWLVVTICAIKSPSLGDVLGLVGAATGTMLAFVLPALFSFKLKGVDAVSLAILGIGGMVGLLGTIFSFIKLTKDITT